ncbi:hypothetical protein D3C87_2139830 [compost metagenome]
MAKFTALASTPGTLAAAFSTRLTQEAQVMPSTGRMMGRRAAILVASLAGTFVDGSGGLIV